MNHLRRVIGLLGLLGLAAAPARADVTLPPIISNKMVLQANTTAPIFGTADENELVTVEFNGQKKITTAAKDGKWMVKLDPLKPGGPYELKVAGRNTITVKDVLVGEVWLASGQSNMRYEMWETADGLAEIAKANVPTFRYFFVKSRQWVACTPETARSFAGPAYHFVRDLMPRMKGTPFAVIDTSVSGAIAQAFVSEQAFLDDPALAKMVSAQTKISRCSGIFREQFQPIMPFAIRGALWCQGEGNRDYPVTYRKLLPALIADWRKHWGLGDFPVLVVQLANWKPRTAKPVEAKDCALRESQLKTVQTTPNTALVVTIDLGVEDVHYPNKKPVGERLALAARAVAYGEKIEYSGPIFDSAKFDGSKATVSFTHLGGGLTAKGGKLTGFLLCGQDKEFVRADAVIEKDKVVVTSPSVSNPIAVRYGWECNPECNLLNKEGLPASPFRSDTFESVATKDGR